MRAGKAVCMNGAIVSACHRIMGYCLPSFPLHQNVPITAAASHLIASRSPLSLILPPGHAVSGTANDNGWERDG